MLLTTKPSIEISDRIPVLQKAAFSAGTGSSYIATTLMLSYLWLPFFNIGMGMSPMVLGVILMLLRLYDAFTDVIMGNLSDNTRTRWGRRRPFIFIGAILTGCLYPLIWAMPASLGSTGKFFYLLVAGLLFLTACTIWSIAYHGLELELTPNYDERTRLAGWVAIFSKVFALGGSWVLALATGPWFQSDTGGADLVRGIRTVTWALAPLLIILGILPALFVKERYYEKDAARQTREPLLKSLMESLQCRPLLQVIGVSFGLMIAGASIGAVAQYLNIYYIFDGDISRAAVLTGWKGTMTSILGIALVPFWTWLGQKFDKRNMVFALILVAIFGHSLYLVCLNPAHPYLQLVPAAFEISSLTAVWLFIPAMKADIADYDELSTHRRREGALNAFFSWFYKAALTISVGAGGWLLELTGFDVAVGKQPPEVLARMYWIFLLLPIVIWVFAIGCLARYPLTRKRMAEIRGELELRRGSV